MIYICENHFREKSELESGYFVGLLLIYSFFPFTEYRSFRSPLPWSPHHNPDDPYGMEFPYPHWAVEDEVVPAPFEEPVAWCIQGDETPVEDGSVPDYPEDLFCFEISFWQSFLWDQKS